MTRTAFGFSLCLALLGSLGPAAAFAGDDAPRAAATGDSAGAGAAGPSAADLAEAPRKRPGSFFRLFGIGAATTMVVTPASMALGAWIGTWSNNLYAALIPAILLVVLVPPLVTALVEHALGNALWGKGTFKLGWSLVSGFLVQAALVVICVFAGLPGATVPGIAIFTALDVVLLAGTTSGVMWATRIEPMATVASRDEIERGGSAGSTDLPRAPAAALTTVRF